MGFTKNVTSGIFKTTVATGATIAKGSVTLADSTTSTLINYSPDVYDKYNNQDFAVKEAQALASERLLVDKELARFGWNVGAKGLYAGAKIGLAKGRYTLGRKITNVHLSRRDRLELEKALKEAKRKGLINAKTLEFNMARIQTKSDMELIEKLAVFRGNSEKAFRSLNTYSVKKGQFADLARNGRRKWRSGLSKTITGRASRHLRKGRQAVLGESDDMSTSAFQTADTIAFVSGEFAKNAPVATKTLVKAGKGTVKLARKTARAVISLPVKIAHLFTMIASAVASLPTVVASFAITIPIIAMIVITVVIVSVFTSMEWGRVYTLLNESDGAITRMKEYYDYDFNVYEVLTYSYLLGMGDSDEYDYYRLGAIMLDGKKGDEAKKLTLEQRKYNVFWKYNPERMFPSTTLWNNSSSVGIDFLKSISLLGFLKGGDMKYSDLKYVYGNWDDRKGDDKLYYGNAEYIQSLYDQWDEAYAYNVDIAGEYYADHNDSGQITDIADVTTEGYGSINPLSAKYKGQCTWYCWGRVWEVWGVRAPTRNADKWYDDWNGNKSSDRAGAKAGSVLVLGSKKHVVFIEGVGEDGSVITSEGNYGLTSGNGACAKEKGDNQISCVARHWAEGIHTHRWSSIEEMLKSYENYGHSFIGYIYFN